jgi:dienelactone hydrolase
VKTETVPNHIVQFIRPLFAPARHSVCAGPGCNGDWQRSRSGAPRRHGALFVACVLPLAALAQDSARLAGTQPLSSPANPAAQMVAGIDRFLLRELDRSVAGRAAFWQRDFSSPAAYENSLGPNRERLRRIIGAVDERLPVTALELVSDTDHPARIAETASFAVYAVRWPVLAGVQAEGLWLRPRTNAPPARVVAIPDADQTPEMLAGLAPGLRPERQFARRLAEQGCEVIVPVLVNRDDTWSGHAAIQRFTNQPHREWIYRQAFELGRHLIGYEVQKVLAAVDWFRRQSEIRDPKSEIRIGVAGYGEGGLIAFYSAALDPRIEATLVSGYFDSRQRIWAEPVYRNVFGLLREFGDAEIATLIAPRALIVEYSEVPKVDGPPPPRAGRVATAAPGRWETPDYSSVEAEFERARALVEATRRKDFDHFTLITGTEGRATGPGSDRALVALLQALGRPGETLQPPGETPKDLRRGFDANERQHRQVTELVGYTQKLFRDAERARKEFFWRRVKTDSPANFAASIQPLREYFQTEIIGVFTNATLPANPRSRKIMDEPDWTGYEVMLDVFPDVYAWGYLLLPKDLKPGERRPVVVCQHGLEGAPADLVITSPRSDALHIYNAFAARLAERGFVVFAPQNPYRGGDAFRQLQRKANPLGKTLFAVITAQHRQLLDWLAEQPFADPARIAFYGMSYGGKTALRVPPLLDRYALSICSGDFNEWIQKMVSLDFPASFMFAPEYEVFEFNLGNTFGYAELAALIAPRPFMVERGRQDPMATDEWVSYEYAKVQRLYHQLGFGGQTRIEFFDGGHTVNGVGTFEFLQEHLNWRRAEK